VKPRRFLARALAGCWLGVVGTVTACASSQHSAGAPVSDLTPHGDAIEFSYATTTGGVLSDQSTHGRATAILFVTTYDPLSQLEAQRLENVLRTTKPRVNCGVVVLEAPKYAVLAQVFGETLGLSYPVGLADDDTLHGRGPFGPVRGVPTLVVLDRSGREVWRKAGLASTREIAHALAVASHYGFAVLPGGAG
jgi:hypothetical protein